MHPVCAGGRRLWRGDEDEGAGQGVQSFEQMVEADHRAVAAFVKGDPEPKKRLWSRSDEATLANPFGPPARGPKGVAKALERGASRLRDGEPLGFDRISHYATQDLAYVVEIERYRMKVAGAEELAPVSLRATTIYRREENGWRILHRHADPITQPRPPESVLQR